MPTCALMSYDYSLLVCILTVEIFRNLFWNNSFLKSEKTVAGLHLVKYIQSVKMQAMENESFQRKRKLLHFDLKTMKLAIIWFALTWTDKSQELDVNKVEFSLMLIITSPAQDWATNTKVLIKFKLV